METRYASASTVNGNKRVCVTKPQNNSIHPNTPALLFRLPTPASLSPPSHSIKKLQYSAQYDDSTTHPQHSQISNSLDSWQSRLSSPLPPRQISLDPSALVPYGLVCEYVPPASPRLEYLLSIEKSTHVERSEWLSKNKNFDIDYQKFDLFRQCISKSSDEPNETAFIATRILQKAASKKRILTQDQKEGHFLGALLLASKICEENDPKVADLIIYANYKVSLEHVLSAERKLAVDVEWCFQYASPTELGYAMLDCFCNTNGNGIKSNVKIAIMSVAAPVIYEWIFNDNIPPSLIVAAVLVSIFVYIYKGAKRRNWISFFASLILSPASNLELVVKNVEDQVHVQIEQVLKAKLP
jgi:hypothetical protein